MSWAGQDRFTQRTATSPGRRVTGSPQDGQWSGKDEFPFPAGPLLHHGPDHLRDHIPPRR